MIELEVLVEVLDTYDDAKKALSPFEYIGDEIIVDSYFYDPLRNGLKPNSLGKTFESLRIRKQSKNAKLTYKRDVYETNVWQYSDETEIYIEDDKKMKEIFLCLGFRELLTINNYRRYYSYGEYEIVLEKVKDLGTFIEVEYKDEISALEIVNKREDIHNFIKNLKLRTSHELNAGKPELYIVKHSIKIEKN